MSRHPFVRLSDRWSRKLHRLGAIVLAAPILVIIVAGLLLQMKKNWAWVQPPEQRGTAAAADGGPAIEWARVLEVARGVQEAGVKGWDDIERLDVRIGARVLKVQCAGNWELQIDTGTGALLQSAPRRSDVIESIHDGSFFHPLAKMWVFLPAGIGLLGLWTTGMYLWARPVWAKRAGRRRRARHDASRAN